MIVVFALYLLIYIQLPGILLYFSATRENRLTVDSLLQSFFLGFGVLTLEYFILGLLGARWLFITFSPVLIIMLVLMLRNRSNEVIKNMCCTKIDFRFPIIVVIIGVNTCITQRYAFCNIEEYSSIYLYQDIVWHIGNVASLSTGLPFADYRLSGLNFNYHYFNDLLFGMCKYCFGFNASDLLLQCTPLVTVYVFSLGIYSFLKQITSRVIIGLGLFICSGATIPYFILNNDENYSLINYHIFSNINGVAVSLAAVIASWLAFARIDEGKKIRIADNVTLAIILYTLTGLKGPFAAVVVVSMLIVTVIRFFDIHHMKKVISVTTAIIASFSITYIFVIKGWSNLFREGSNNRVTDISISGTFSRTRLWEHFSYLLDYGDKVHLLGYCLCVTLLGTAIAVGICFVLFMIDTIVIIINVFRRDGVPPAKVLLSITAGWTGVAGFWLVSHSGFSQAYFLFVGVLFIVGESLRFMDSLKQRHLRIMLNIVVAISIVINGLVYAYCIKETLNNDESHFSFNNEEDKNDMSVLTHKEMEGLIWLRNNTNRDIVVASDRQLLHEKRLPAAKDDARCFYYSAFGERQVFIEGFSYSDVTDDIINYRLGINKDIYSGDNDTSRRAVEASGVDYIIVSRRINDSLELPGDIVFSNKDITIYKRK